MVTEPGGASELDLWGRGVRDFLEARGFAASVPPGRRPAVVVIDLSRAFTDPASPVGADLDAIVAATAHLLDEARRREVPIFFFSLAYMADFSDANTIVLKQPSTRVLVLGSPVVEIDERLRPGADEPVTFKKAASCFFGTPLAPMLVSRGIDTLILTGCSTSGCVRATAVDAQSYGYRVLVPRECVGDRTAEAHRANLFDIQAKIGEVVGLEDTLAYLRDLPR